MNKRAGRGCHGKENPRDASGGGRPRILVMDGYLPNIKLVALLLQPLGATVLPASTGPEALAILRESCLDLVILEVDLPGSSGLEVAREMQANLGMARVPILATAFSAEDHADEILRAGCTTWISKPLNIHEFLQTVQQLLTGH